MRRHEALRNTSCKELNPAILKPVKCALYNKIKSCIWSHLLKKSLMKNFILCAVKFDQLASCLDQRRYA